MFRLSRRRRRAAAPPPMDRDPAYDDLALRVARDRAITGDWAAARDMLAAAGTDWELRGSRVAELARVAARDDGWLRAWLSAAPDDPSAVLVDGARRARRAPGAEVDGQSAEAVLRRAAALAPEYPCPWVEQLWAMVEGGGRRSAFVAVLAEAQRRDPHHYGAHRAAMHFASAARHGSHAEMFAVARRAGGLAPSGSAAAVLPVEAHVEYARRTVREPGGFDRRTLMALRGYFEQDEVRAEIVACGERWRRGRGPRAVAPRHHEAAAYFLLDDRERLRMVLDEIGPYVGGGHPWHHFATDDVLFVVAWRRAYEG